MWKRMYDSTTRLNTLEGNPGFRRVFPFALQQVLAMFVTNLVPIGLIIAAAVPALSQEESMHLVQTMMIAAGLATILQATPIWKIGSGLPIFMGASFTFAIPLAAIAAKHGYGAVTGTVLAGGLLEGALGLTVRYWKKLVAPIVSAVVVTGIGLSLFASAARSFGGGYAEDFGSLPNILIGTVTMAVCLIWEVKAKGTKKQFAILAGMIAGYVTALLLEKVDLRALHVSGWFSLPKILPYKPVFHLDAIISVGIIYLVSATETLGDCAAFTAGVLHREPSREEVTGVLMLDGLGSFLSGLLGGTPVTSYSENIGLSIMTGVANRNVARCGGILLVLAGLFPPVAGFMGTVPKPVIGGVLMIVMGQIMVSGIEMIAAAGFNSRNKLITAISLSVAIGFTTSTEAGIWSSFPVAVQSVFSQNVVAVIFIIAILLNLVLPKSIDFER